MTQTTRFAGGRGLTDGSLAAEIDELSASLSSTQTDLTDVEGAFDLVQAESLYAIKESDIQISLTDPEADVMHDFTWGNGTYFIPLRTDLGTTDDVGTPSQHPDVVKWQHPHPGLIEMYYGPSGVGSLSRVWFKNVSTKTATLTFQVSALTTIRGVFDNVSDAVDVRIVPALPVGHTQGDVKNVGPAPGIVMNATSPAVNTAFLTGSDPAYVTISQPSPQAVMNVATWRVVILAGKELDLRIQLNNRTPAGATDGLFVKRLNIKSYVGLS